MTRNEEIRQEALNWKTDDNEFIAQTAFEAGAKWADEHPKSPWISVKDKLPKYDVPVFVHFKDGSKTVGKLFYEPPHKYWSTHLDDDDWTRFKDIDYWMPIPELPKGGEE